MTCEACGRSFRSSKARDLYHKRMAILREFREGIPAPHIGPIIAPKEPYVPRPIRHKIASEAFRRTGA